MNHYNQQHLCEIVSSTVHRQTQSNNLISADELCLRLSLEMAQGQRNVNCVCHDLREINTIVNAISEARDKNHIAEIIARNGTVFYYAPHIMSLAYAELILTKNEDQIWMMISYIRRNSEKYPQPIPMDVFLNPPFDLTSHEIESNMGKINTDGEYSDISSTETSAGTIFLFSTKYLNNDHAAMLAEWIDVGQANNP